jgi:hypothetical protein
VCPHRRFILQRQLPGRDAEDTSTEASPGVPANRNAMCAHHRPRIDSSTVPFASLVDNGCAVFCPSAFTFPARAAIPPPPNPWQSRNITRFRLASPHPAIAASWPSANRRGTARGSLKFGNSSSCSSRHSSVAVAGSAGRRSLALFTRRTRRGALHSPCSPQAAAQKFAGHSSNGLSRIPVPP